MKIYGKNPVLERLKSDPKSVRRIFVVSGHPEHGYIATKAKKHGIPVLVVHPHQMLKMGKSQNTQGLLMDVEDFAYVPYDALLDAAVAEGLTLIFLDSLTVHDQGARWSVEFVRRQSGSRRFQPRRWPRRWSAVRSSWIGVIETRSWSSAWTSVPGVACPVGGGPPTQ